MKTLLISLIISISVQAAITSDGVTATTNPAMTITHTMYASSSGAAGASNVGSMVFRPTGSSSPPYNQAGVCDIEFDVTNHLFSLAMDNGNFISGHAGDGNTLSSSSCSFPLSSASYTIGTNQVSFTVTVTYAAGYAGQKYMWTYVNASGSAPWQTEYGTGWLSKGLFTVGTPAPPIVTSLTLSSNNTVTNHVTVTVYDAAGFADLLYTTVSVGSNLWAPGTCTEVSFINGARQVFLMPDDGSYNWITAPPYHNSQCDASNFTVSVNGNNATIGFDLAASPLFFGAKSIHTMVVNNSNQYTQAFNMTIWNIPAPDISLSATEINTHQLLLDDATGQYIERPTSISPWIVRLKDGRNVHVAAADNVKIKKLSHSWEPIGDSFVYHYKIDTRDNPYIMRLGITEDQFIQIGAPHQETFPEGWLPSGVGWINLYGKAALAEESEFSLTSKWKPGLQALFVMSHAAKEPIPSFPETENNIRIVAAANIFNNSVRKFVIGPAIDPAITADGLKDLVQRWVEDYGFGFLGPYLSGAALSDIKPNDGFESEILQCLRNAVPRV